MSNQNNENRIKTADEVAAEFAMAPDASARDAVRRGQIDNDAEVLRAEDLIFITRGVTTDEQAVVAAVLATAREEETNRVRRVGRLHREPWARSQRTPEGIGDLLSG